MFCLHEVKTKYNKLASCTRGTHLIEDNKHAWHGERSRQVLYKHAALHRTSSVNHCWVAILSLHSMPLLPHYRQSQSERASQPATASPGHSAQHGHCASFVKCSPLARCSEWRYSAWAALLVLQRFGRTRDCRTERSSSENNTRLGNIRPGTRQIAWR